ncbi:MAG: quinol:cytochrome C oxidoreductase, partial [Muriicola sp.]
MYTFSNRLKIGALILIGIGMLGMGIGFVTAPSSVEDAKAMVAAHDEEGHGESHAEEGDHGVAVADHSMAAEHDAAHDEHLLHQLQNRPWSALYVAAFFFFMISLGVLAFYAIQRAAQAGWSPLLF